MSININLELELNEIIGPYGRGTEDGVVQTNFYVIMDNKTLGGLSEAVVQLTDHTVKVAIFNGGRISARSTIEARGTIEALVVRGFLEDLLKDVGVSIEADLIGLYTDGYINISPEVSELIKALLRGKRDSLLKEH